MADVSTGAVNHTSSEARRSRIVRFSLGERLVHRSVAILMLTCIATAAILYNGFLAVPVGHRRLVKLVHVFSGYALPIPILLGLVSAAYRSDLGRLNRFSPSDWRWLRSRRRRDGAIRVAKFNAGQKLNGALSTGSIIVMLLTGTLMYVPDLARLSWRTGASFVHDWFALALGLLVIGHISFAVRDPESRRGMRTGSVSASWARRHHSSWAAELGVAEEATDPEAAEPAASESDAADPDAADPSRVDRPVI